MALITFHSERSDKSSLVMYKGSEFEFSGTPVYIPKMSWPNAKQGDVKEIPAMNLVPLTDKDGEERTAKNGSVLLQFGGVK